MLQRLLNLFRKQPTLVQGAAKLPEGESKKLSFGDPLAGRGVDVILAKVGGEILAIDARCPHAGGFLIDGPLVDGRLVTCPLHNYHFDPKSGACTNAPCGKARVYRTEAVGDDVQVYV
ncbi:Rieske (2Fe-2S) protein [Engelhardtia mirabilis]|uniref:Assimilatory nitrite reductase [NAD(P)H] small subunit n=1 Tax=Engelhardtia mirabilis TaxID=2528011 RepID=A0A518BR73_9BACT|nr:Assimilatory nitrite reductase [NAD(P)H] small subunit [Planctomycetes bacterium Pla133]QDV03799.1 Assimilatory nitrite reductase [NAD(P)H] small subunit [Planctomycetes bacterium Pla86]